MEYDDDDGSLRVLNHAKIWRGSSFMLAPTTTNIYSFLLVKNAIYSNSSRVCGYDQGEASLIHDNPVKVDVGSLLTII
jgi:hypothetical protein